MITQVIGLRASLFSLIVIVLLFVCIIISSSSSCCFVCLCFKLDLNGNNYFCVTKLHVSDLDELILSLSSSDDQLLWPLERTTASSKRCIVICWEFRHVVFEDVGFEHNS